MLYRDFQPEVIAPASLERPAIWLAFQSGKLMMFEDDQGLSVPEGKEFAAIVHSFASQYTCSEHFLGRYFGQPIFAVNIPCDVQLQPPFVLKDLRGLMMKMDEVMFLIAGRARQIVQWDEDHQFCSRCGTATVNHSSDRAKECPSCSYTQYPRISPCVIGLVTRGPEVLLARSPSFPPGMFSTLAGFVEPGETLEQAFAREVKEEVGVSIGDIHYQSSQPWPFPHSLMIGFEAVHAGGEIVIDGVEIQEAEWFHVDRLPLIPPQGSISNDLIVRYVNSWQQSIAKGR